MRKKLSNVIETITDMQESMKIDLDKFHKGNMRAGQRVRVSSVLLSKALKTYREESIRYEADRKKSKKMAKNKTEE